MKKLLKINFMLVAISTLCLGCHKYQDDSFIEVQNPKKAILGWYYVANYYINGADSINTLPYVYLSTKTLMEFREGSNNFGSDYKVWIENWGYNAYSHQCGYKANFVNDKKSLSIEAFNNKSYGISVFVTDKSTWDILKMSNDELWLISTINNNIYEIHLKK